jgi:hypothetical protein
MHKGVAGLVAIIEGFLSKGPTRGQTNVDVRVETTQLLELVRDRGFISRAQWQISLTTNKNLGRSTESSILVAHTVLGALNAIVIAIPTAGSGAGIRVENGNGVLKVLQMGC